MEEHNNNSNRPSGGGDNNKNPKNRQSILMFLDHRHGSDSVLELYRKHG